MGALIRDDHYVLCTGKLLKERRLKPFSKELYLYIKFRHQLFSSRGDVFRESISTMALFFEVNEKTIRRAIDELVQTGWVMKEGGGQREPLILTPS